MNMPEILLHAREATEPVGGTAYAVRIVLALTFVAVLCSEYRGRTPTAAPWSTWALVTSGITLLTSSILHVRSPSYSRPSATLASISTITTKLYLAAALHPAASSATRRLLQPGALLIAFTAVPAVVLGCVPVEGLQCKGSGCFPVETWAALSSLVEGFSTVMDLALVGVALRMTLKRHFNPRERCEETIAIGFGAAAFIAGLLKLTKFAHLSTGDFSYGESILLWTTAESCLIILSGAAIAPHTSQERVKRPRSPPTDDDSSGRTFEVGREERGESVPSDSELLRRSMVRAGLL